MSPLQPGSYTVCFSSDGAEYHLLPDLTLEGRERERERERVRERVRAKSRLRD